MTVFALPLPLQLFLAFYVLFVVWATVVGFREACSR